MSYADPGNDSCVSLSGLATIVEDQAKKEALFSPMSQAWFPAGPTDPNLALLKVEINHSEYWDVKESKMLQLAKMAKAVIAGEAPQKLGEHKELNLS
jgi:general stress protein 26